MNNLKYFPTFLKEIMLAFMLGFLSFGCVGTIEEGLNKETQYRDPDVGGFEYPGIIQARAIAHDKIEVEFEPSFDESEYSYFLHINEGTPIKLSLESLREGQIGYLKYTLIDLERNVPYKLRVSVEKNTGEKSSRENEVIVTTFDNVVARFNGITSVESIPGQSHSSIKISWVPSPITGALSDNFDVRVYEITYIPKTTGLQYINTPGATGRVVNTTTVATGPSNNPTYAIINNLEESTSYYFQVRAIHKLYETHRQKYEESDGEEPITVDRDMNTSWLEFRTTGRAGVYDFNQSSVEVQTADGKDGKTAVNVFWQSAQGIFNNYRIFYKRYPLDSSNENEPDQAIIDNMADNLKKEDLQPWITAGVNPVENSGSPNHSGWIDVDTSKTHVKVNGLNAYEWYQFKVVPCKELNCKVDPATEADSSVLSKMVPKKTVPKLAPFYGISSINHPQNPDKLDEVTFKFAPPVMTSGYATRMRVYCLGTTMTDAVAFPENGDPITSSGVGNCDGLSYVGNLVGEENLKNASQLLIQGVKNTSTSPENEASYCFAMTPVIDDMPNAYDGSGEDNKVIKIAKENWVVRCIIPEPKTPRLDEFAGLNGSCNVNMDTAKVSWNKPLGGIYNKFRLFLFRKDAGHEKFEFSTAIDKLKTNDTTQYEAVTLDNNTFEYTFSDLEVGKSYYIGALAVADSGTPTDVTDDLYSEFNLNFQECRIPYPVASFDEWTRIFAIGPKTDGRVPKDIQGVGVPEVAYIHEALNKDGIPYEVARSGNYNDGFGVLSTNFTVAPGFGAGLTITDPDFDGALSADGASSKKGIVSLAWKDVSLNFKENIFEDNQDHSNRASRKFGYHIYRSDDNKGSWRLLNDKQLIHAGDYEYRLSTSVPTTTTTSMAFFTDYTATHYESLGASLEIDRARIYWYKIVPVYDGIELKYNDDETSNPHNIIKVTLPPANMALVHRMMANRNICSELGKNLNKNENYSCDYNGIGAVARTIPWRMGNTIYDFKHDMLVDRFELGCNFTRGDSNREKEEIADGNSIFNVASGESGFKLELKSFKGFASSGDGAANLLRGCTQGEVGIRAGRVLSSHVDEMDLIYDDYDSNQFNSLVYGDCIFNNSLTIARTACTNADEVDHFIWRYPQLINRFNYQGQNPLVDQIDCSVTKNNEPTFLYGNNNPETSDVGLFDENFIDYITIQAEHAAVIWNRNSSSNSQFFAPYGPNPNYVSGSTDPDEKHPTKKVGSDIISDSFMQSCFINLAAIGADPGDGSGAAWKSRWLPVNMLDKITTARGEPFDPRVPLREFHQEPHLYTQNAQTTDDYRVPSGMWDARRFDENTKVGRIFSSNASKLPPLTSFSRQDAQRLCQAYEIEVGFGKDGESYTQVNAPRKKRLLRKQEFTVAAAHSDSKDMTDAKITSLEAGDTSVGNDYGRGACISNNRVDGVNNAFNLENNPKLASNIANPGQSTFVLTGSSPFDLRDSNDTQHSSECISRYGIQDIIGNLGEVTSDVLFCDYREDALLYGDTSTRSNSVVLDGYLEKRNDHDKYVRRIDRGTRSVFWANAKITQRWDGGELTLMSDPKLWVQSGSDTGYCSLVDRDINRVTGSSEVFRGDTGNFRTITNFNGTINRDLLKMLNTADYKTVDSARNGDGYYLHWGPRGIMPPLGEDKNTMAINAVGVDHDALRNKKGDFFSPVLGLPLACRSETCKDSGDNKAFSTPFQKVVSTGTGEEFSIHNSQILHSSIGTFSETYPVRDLGDGGNLNYNVATEVIINAADDTPVTDWDTISSVEVVTKSINQMITEGLVGSSDSVQFEKMDFDIMRHSALHFVNGGSYSDNINGRYSMRLGAEAASSTGEPTRGSEHYSKRSATGIRCGIKIGEN